MIGREVAVELLTTIFIFFSIGGAYYYSVYGKKKSSEHTTPIKVEAEENKNSRLQYKYEVT